jgi:hypothetical protein
MTVGSTRPDDAGPAELTRAAADRRAAERFAARNARDLDVTLSHHATDIGFELQDTVVDSGSVAWDYSSVGSTRCIETLTLDPDFRVVHARAPHGPIPE